MPTLLALSRHFASFVVPFFSDLCGLCASACQPLPKGGRLARDLPSSVFRPRPGRSEIGQVESASTARQNRDPRLLVHVLVHANLPLPARTQTRSRLNGSANRPDSAIGSGGTYPVRHRSQELKVQDGEFKIVLEIGKP